VQALSDEWGRIPDIVPDADALVVEVKIAVEDISDVQPDMRAEII